METQLKGAVTRVVIAISIVSIVNTVAAANITGSSKYDDGLTFSTSRNSSLCVHGNHRNHNEKKDSRANFTSI